MVNWRKALDIKGLGCPDPRNIHRIVGINSSTVAAWYAGYTDASLGLLNIVDPTTKTFTAYNSPTKSKSKIQATDGNRIQAIKYVRASSQYHSQAKASWMDIWAGSYTVVQVYKATSGISGTQSLINNYTSLTSGIESFMNPNFFFNIYGTSTTQLATTGLDFRDDLYHIFHVVVGGGIGKLFVDGVLHDVKAVPYQANSGTSNLVIGQLSGHFDGDYVYLRLNNAAMTDAQVAREVQLWQGCSPGTAVFHRSQMSGPAAYSELEDRTLVQVPANWPRFKQGALVQEAAATNLFLYSEQFDNAAWTKQGTVTANQDTAPSEALTADLFVERIAGDGDVEHGVNPATAPTITASASYVISVYAKFKASGRPDP